VTAAASLKTYPDRRCPTTLWVNGQGGWYSAVLILPKMIFDPCHCEERLRRGNLPPHLLWIGLPRRKRFSQ
jgi:hypothetical protein